MDNNKIQIELNNHPYNKDVYYIAIGLRGGYAVRNYIVDEKKVFTSNYAFFNILFNYFTSCNSMPGLHFDVQRAAATISFSRSRAELIPSVEKALQMLFNHEYNQELFESAKLAAKEAFSARYKDGAFRSKYKAHEFSELNKGFSLKALITNIEGIDFSTFVATANTILVPGNVCIYIVGDTTNINLQDITLQNVDTIQNNSVRIAGPGYDPLLRQDAHIINIAREEHNTIIETIDFLNSNATNFAKVFLTEMLAEQIPAHYVDVWVDSLDASIVFSSEMLRSFKNNLHIDTEKSYAESQAKLLTKYSGLMKNNPEHFVIKAATLMTIGVYIDQYLEFLSKCTYEMFSEMCVTADFKITEAQIVLRKGSK